MINDEDIKSLIQIAELQPPNKIEVIQRYIFDLKEKQVNINIPRDMINQMLMEQAYNIAKEYYLDKFKENNAS